MGVCSPTRLRLATKCGLVRLAAAARPAGASTIRALPLIREPHRSQSRPCFPHWPVALSKNITLACSLAIASLRCIHRVLHTSATPSIPLRYTLLHSAWPPARHPRTASYVVACRLFLEPARSGSSHGVLSRIASQPPALVASHTASVSKRAIPLAISRRAQSPYILQLASWPSSLTMCAVCTPITQTQTLSAPLFASLVLTARSFRHLATRVFPTQNLQLIRSNQGNARRHISQGVVVHERWIHCT